ncbi:universal stress protein [Halorussus limi]|uniref:universal stress protein n=1 Tax=Halorussus limi TaxID=2938695 RepID=UPI0034A25514
MPVFTVQATERSVVGDGYEDVLIPTDGSECAELAVEHGLAIAQRYDATVHAVSVVDLRAVAAGGDAGGVPEAEVLPTTETGDQLDERGEKATEAVAERAREAGLDAVSAVRQGIPVRDLLDYTEENDVDLVAMGTHGRTGFDRYFLGSTTAKLVRASGVPVLTVRAPRDDE